MPPSKVLKDYDCSMAEYIIGRKLPRLTKAPLKPETKTDNKNATTLVETKSIVKKVTVSNPEKSKDSKSSAEPTVETKTITKTKVTVTSTSKNDHEGMPKLVRFDENKLEQYSKVAPSTKRAQRDSGDIYSEGGVKINKRSSQEHASDCEQCNTDKFGFPDICDTCIRSRAAKGKAKSADTKDGKDGKNGKNGNKGDAEKKDGLIKGKTPWDEGLGKGKPAWNADPMAWEKKISDSILGPGWGSTGKTPADTNNSTGWDVGANTNNSGTADNSWGAQPAAANSSGWDTQPAVGNSSWDAHPVVDNSSWDTLPAVNGSSWDAPAPAENSSSDWNAQPDTNNSSGWDNPKTQVNNNISSIWDNNQSTNNQASFNNVPGWNSQSSNDQANNGWGGNNQNLGQNSNLVWGNNQGQAQSNNWHGNNMVHNQPTNMQNAGNRNNGQNNVQSGSPWYGNQSAYWLNWPIANAPGLILPQGQQGSLSQSTLTILPRGTCTLQIGNTTVTIHNDPIKGTQFSITTGTNSSSPVSQTVPGMKGCLKNGTNVDKSATKTVRFIDTSKYTWVPDPPAASQRCNGLTSSPRCPTCHTARSWNQDKDTLASIWTNGICGCAPVLDQAQKDTNTSMQKHAALLGNQQQQQFKPTHHPYPQVVIQIATTR